jgi:hypothetical protein
MAIKIKFKTTSPQKQPFFKKNFLKNGCRVLQYVV